MLHLDFPDAKVLDNPIGLKGKGKSRGTCAAAEKKKPVGYSYIIQNERKEYNLVKLGS